MAQITLNNGRRVTLNWRPEYRPENLNFVSAADNRPIKASYWQGSKCLNQGQEGACALFGSGHVLDYYFPNNPQITNQFCFDNYNRAKKIDPFPGEDYSGTTINAALNVLKNLGWIESYQWHMSFRDMLVDLSYRPVVAGFPWFEGMYQTDDWGYIVNTGKQTGGHCTMLNRNMPELDTLGGHNSWGEDWSPLGADFLIKYNVAEFLWNNGGQSAIFTPAANVPVQEVETRLNVLQRLLQLLWG
jgi:hypothetical protein